MHKIMIIVIKNPRGTIIACKQYPPQIHLFYYIACNVMVGGATLLAYLCMLASSRKAAN